jgi:hypothetical protein
MPDHSPAGRDRPFFVFGHVAEGAARCLCAEPLQIFPVIDGPLALGGMASLLVLGRRRMTIVDFDTTRLGAFKLGVEISGLGSGSVQGSVGISRSV